MITHIYPTSRSIRERVHSKLQDNSFLDNYITMGDFLSRVILIDDRRFVDDDLRAIYLLEASDFSNFSKLHIERNFFSFLQNSSYIFRFFEELHTELVDIQALEVSDTYADYDEHIQILKELKENYRRICEREKVADKIFVSELYTFNASYVASYEKIILHVDGYLSNFELKLIEQCAEVTAVEIEYSASKYTKKMLDRFEKMGISVEPESVSTLDINSLTCKESTPLHVKANIRCEMVSERILQVAFVKERVYDYIQEGLEPNEIVVIVPDESFASYLRLFDDENNFNFAMGKPISQLLFFKKLEALMLYSENRSVQNSQRLSRLSVENFDTYMQREHQLCSIEFFKEFIEVNLEGAKKSSAIEKIRDELHYFLLLEEELKKLTTKAVIKLFINRLNSLSVDDVGSGKITVMGVLESRQISYKGVIVVDFNEDIVPRRNQKDMYINSEIRSRASLPDTSDRENLQRHYYYLLFARALHVSLCYVSSEQKVASRFLSILHINVAKEFSDAQYASILYPLNVKHEHLEEEIAMEYDFSKVTLSASGLKKFLTCKRAYYYKYIKNIKEHEIAEDLPKESVIGNYLHEALENLYKEKKSFSDINLLRSELFKHLKEVAGSSILDEFILKQWLEKLQTFFEHEIERFSQGVQVYKCEERLHVEVEGIKLFGVIDRMDTHSGIIEVIDYKSGKYKIDTKRTFESAKDFQLEFYYLLASQEGEVERCYYYDLNSGELHEELLLHEKIEVLKNHLKYLNNESHFVFDKTERLSDCQFCAYKILCDRE